ncbi:MULTISPECIES: YceI family protein [unclassified Streptomyces]|uniref:YceI family protein n=1 Tax=unclassified Streptomyces TaxID=2593676 RepID=UPI0033DEDDAD
MSLTEPHTRPGPADLAGAWTLEPSASSVEFTGRHFLLLPVTGSMPVRSGAAELDGDGRLGHLDVALDAAGFTTGNPRRDDAVRGPAFLDTERHPLLRFDGETLAVDEPWTVSGLLSVKGRAVPLVLTVDEVVPEGARAVVRASATVDRHACGVSAMRAMVGPRLRVRVTAVFVRA